MADIQWTVDALGSRIEAFLDPVLDAADLDLEYDIFTVDRSEKDIGPEIAVDFDGDDTSLLLQRRGELLLSLEQLTVEALRIPHHDRHRLLFDVNEYRMVRIDELCLTANKAAEQVIRTGKRFTFQPMTSRERRIVHISLRGYDSITTFSEGVPPNRYTVIETKRD